MNTRSTSNEHTTIEQKKSNHIDMLALRSLIKIYVAGRDRHDDSSIYICSHFNGNGN